MWKEKTQMNETMMEKSEERDRHEGRLDTVDRYSDQLLTANF